MRWLVALGIALATVTARADGILLVPLDSRPAAGQFAQMIARIAGEELRMPPYESLGRFVNPGSPEEVLQWLSVQDVGKVRTLVVSADMICYGGLIASRANRTSEELALLRLRKLLEIRKRSPNTKLYVFSSTMRLAPTATRAAAPWRMRLAKYEELKDMSQRLGIARVRPEMEAIKASLPPGSIESYEAARKRNHTVQRALVEAAAKGQIDYLVIGQDDAKPYGPHIPETERLRTLVKRQHAERNVYFCEGIDQHASILVSRALTRRAGWMPRVRVVYSDPAGRKQYANFESKPIEESLADQIVASGAQVAEEGTEYDYSLYLNTPKRRPEMFKVWLENLKGEIEQGLPVAVADINFSANATADPEVFDALWEDARLMRLLAYAGWNTAGNTMGTTVPAANVYLLARKLNVDPLKREVAQREFLLHRFVNDYAYHRYTRPLAYGMVLSSTRDEVYGLDYADMNDFVQRDLQKHLEYYFEGQFEGRRFYAGNESFVLSGLKDVKIWLPWPRCYEVRLEFRLDARRANDGTR
jgi:hypothetical protein